MPEIVTVDSVARESLAADRSGVSFSSPTTTEILFGKEWLVAPEAPVPAKILDLAVIPEQSLVKLAGVQDYQVEKFVGTNRLPMVTVKIPEIGNQVSEITEPETVYRSILQTLPLFSDDYVVGDAMACGIVEALELKTPPLRLTVGEVRFEVEDTPVIVFDPVLWRVNDARYAGVNELAKISAVLQIRAEQIRSISTKESRMAIEARMARLGVPAGKLAEFLGKEALTNDRRRLELMNLAIKAQLLTGRFALKQMIMEGRPSKEVFFLAFCLNQFHTGDLAKITADDHGGWNGSYDDLVKELERVQGHLKSL